MVKQTYGWKINGINKCDPNAVAAICEEIEQRDGGVTAAALLEYGRDENSPIHGEFEWDDTTAAERYRLDQARHLIANLAIIGDEDENGARVEHRAFVSVDRGSYRYEGISRVIDDKEKKAKLLQRAEQELTWFQAKYRRLAELTGVFDAIEDFKSRETA